MANLDMEPLNIMGYWTIGIRLKETDSEASHCRDINFYRKKTQMFQINGNLDIIEYNSMRHAIA